MISKYWRLLGDCLIESDEFEEGNFSAECFTGFNKNKDVTREFVDVVDASQKPGTYPAKPHFPN